MFKKIAHMAARHSLFVRKHNRRRLIIIGCLVGLALPAAAFFVFPMKPDAGNTPIAQSHTQSLADAETILEGVRAQHENIFSGLRDSALDIVRESGVSAFLRAAHMAFQGGDIAMDECHILTHYMGHIAYDVSEVDLKTLLSYGIEVCGSGYLHGIEAQVVQRGMENEEEFREEIYRICEVVLGMETTAKCYHGAGHGFMGETIDAKKALAQCETLTGGPVSDVSDCYNGVFSEYTNLVGGVDGNTGLALSGGPPLFLDVPPIDFCASLSDPYQLPCGSELTGLGFSGRSTPADVERALRECAENSYDAELQWMCVRSVAAVAAQHELSHNDTVTFQPYVLTLREELRQAFINGSMGELSTYRRNGVERDWESFCTPFPQSDREFCTAFISHSDAGAVSL